MIQVEEVKSTRELYRYRPEWQSLLDRAAGATIFHTFEWMMTWLESFWLGRPISFLFVRRGSRLVAIVPLLQDVEGELGCAQSLVSPINGHSHRTEILHDRTEELGAIFDIMLLHVEARYGGVRLALHELPLVSSTAEKLAEAAAGRHLCLHTKPATRSPILHLGGDWESYLQSRPKQFRRELARKSRNLEKAGEVRWLTCATSEMCDSALEDVFRIERHSWKERSHSAFSSKTDISLFYRELARKCARRGWLCIYLLYLDSVPIAHIYGVSYGKEQFFLKTSYDESYRHLSPGAVLFGRALQEASRMGIEIVDLLGVESRWKAELMTGVRDHQNACCFSHWHYRCRVCRLYQGQLVPLVKEKLPLFVDLKRRIQSTFPRGFELLGAISRPPSGPEKMTGPVPHVGHAPRDN
jgi:CelD/BcsL family acetyltransferase involved in cellulose biosynthesis